VYCSTFKLYGPAQQPVIDPESHPQRPEPWSYGSAKALAERLLAIASARAGFTYAIVRPTCIYGPGQHLRNAIPVFLQAAWRGEAPTVFGSGTSVRDDVFVSDLVDILAEVAVRRVCGVMHAGGERARTILEVAQLCCDAVAQADGPKGLHPLCDTSKPPKPWLDQRFDTTSTRRQLGYTPTPIAVGLAAEAAWIRAGARHEDAVQDWSSPSAQNGGQAQR
jgi:UDP-glucose 4-epimerase